MSRRLRRIHRRNRLLSRGGSEVPSVSVRARPADTPPMKHALSEASLPRGFRFSATACGLKKTGALDLATAFQRCSGFSRGRLHAKSCGRRACGDFQGEFARFEGPHARRHR